MSRSRLQTSSRPYWEKFPASAYDWPDWRDCWHAVFADVRYSRLMVIPGTELRARRWSP